MIVRKCLGCLCLLCSDCSVFQHLIKADRATHCTAKVAPPPPRTLI